MDEKIILTDRLFAISNSLLRTAYLHAHVYERQPLQRIFRQTRKFKKEGSLLFHKMAYRNAASDFYTPSELLSRDWGKY